MTAVAADFDNDGWPDIYVACDSTPSLLFRNNHDGTFHGSRARDAASRSTKTAWSRPAWASGIGDFNLDGNLDIFKTHFADDTSVLYRNDGKGNFDDVTMRSGLGVETRFIGWGAGIVDLDNDGMPDLFRGHRQCVSGGGSETAQLSVKTPRVIFRNLGNGKFEELIGRGRARELPRRTAAAAARSAISTMTATSTC